MKMYPSHFVPQLKSAMSDEIEYSTFDDHVALLTEKGYLAENFKPAAQLGYWLREFEEQFDQTMLEAMAEMGESHFTMPITGNFNNGLQRVRFDFRYKYDYRSEKLSLLSLHARMGRTSKTYYITDPAFLVRPQEVYELLNRPEELGNNVGLWVKLWHEFQRDRNPENDHKEEKPVYKPPSVGNLPKRLKR